MTELEQAATDFFKAILNTGKAILKHPEFQFKIEATIGVRPDEAAGGQVLADRIKEALDVAKKHSVPLTIEGVSIR